MLDMGFYDDIMQISTKLPKERQTLMFSATMPPRIQQLAKAILRPDAAEVKIAVSRPTEAIEQSAYVCYEGQKTPIVQHLLKNVASSRVIIFASSKLQVKDLTRTLVKSGVKAAEIHSDLDQDRRDEVMLDFRAGRTDVLVATDILARGIDIDDIAMVVNYEVPREAEDYVHRIGRTARAGAGGKAVTLVGPDEQYKFGQIERFLRYDVRKNDMPEGVEAGPDYNPSKRQSRFGSGGGKGRSGNRNGAPKGGRNNGGNAPRGNHAQRSNDRPKVTGDRPRSEKTPRQPRVFTPRDTPSPQAVAPLQQVSDSQAAPKSKRRGHRGGRGRSKGGQTGQAARQ